MHIVSLTIYGDLNENGRYRLIYLIVWLAVYDCLGRKRMYELVGGSVS